MNKLVRYNNYEQFPWIVNKLMQAMTQQTFCNAWESFFDSVVHINEIYADRVNMVRNYIRNTVFQF